jgi:hypothetical protein
VRTNSLVAKTYLTNRVIDRHPGSLGNILVVGVGNNADDSAWQHPAEVRIGPPHLPVQGLTVRKQSKRDALADNDDGVVAVAVLVGEVAARDDRNADDIKEPRRDDAEPRARDFFSVCRSVSLDGERDGWSKDAGIAPRRKTSESDAINARKLSQSARHIAVEIHHLRIFKTHTWR